MRIMNKWQKIVGVVSFGAIGICELLLWGGAYILSKH